MAVMPIAVGCGEPARTAAPLRAFTYDEGGIIRGPRDRKQIALLFTGGDFGEGTPVILDALRERGIRASFFVTGSYLRQPAHQAYLRRMIAEGHYVGPHSDGHPLYCAWENRQQTLVTEAEFRADLEKNLSDLERLGVSRRRMCFFMPPYEWYNARIAGWARDMGLVLINYSPGTRSNADWAPDDHRAFLPSQAIVQTILDYESSQSDGLNGFLLLLHLGSSPARTDKMHLHIAGLLDELLRRGYRFIRVDTLLKSSQPQMQQQQQ